MKNSIKDNFYALMLLDYLVTFIYLIRHTNTLGMLLIIIFTLFVSIAAYNSISMFDDEEDEVDED